MTDIVFDHESWKVLVRYHYEEDLVGIYAIEDGEKLGVLILTEQDAYFVYDSSIMLKKCIHFGEHYYGSLTELFQSQGMTELQARARAFNAAADIMSQGKRVDV